jgi:hypothetical protein
MRALHFHSLNDFHRPAWLNLKLHLPHVLKEPLFWVVVILISLFLIVSLLAVFIPSHSGSVPPYPIFYP